MDEKDEIAMWKNCGSKTQIIKISEIRVNFINIINHFRRNWYVKSNYKPFRSGIPKKEMMYVVFLFEKELGYISGSNQNKAGEEMSKEYS